MIVKLLTENFLEFLRLKVGCTGSYESTLVKMPHCWKTHVTAQIYHDYRLMKMNRCMSLIDDLFPRIVLDKAEYLFMLSSIFTNIS